MNTSLPLTIFEGCDGGGKTTAAKTYALATGAHYVHFSAMAQVIKGFPRLFVEAMMPAVLGHKPVVFDRSWLSDMPYGLAYREGLERLDVVSRRMLERLALRCGAVVVWCDPGWEAIEASFLKRRHLEMLDNTSQLREVWELYAEEGTDLENITYDYKTMDDADLELMINAARPKQLHPVTLQTAGRWDAPVVLVGDKFAEHKEHDPFYQWPFASFNNRGCSKWLTAQLESIEVSENDLLWFNADMELSYLADLRPKLVVALGDKARRALTEYGIPCEVVNHPQHAKGFHPTARYGLLDLLEKAHV